MLLGVRRAEELRMSPGHLARVTGRMELPFTEMGKAVGGAGVWGCLLDFQTGILSRQREILVWNSRLQINFRVISIKDDIPSLEIV